MTWSVGEKLEKERVLLINMVQEEKVEFFHVLLIYCKALCKHPFPSYTTDWFDLDNSDSIFLISLPRCVKISEEELNSPEHKVNNQYKTQLPLMAAGVY